MADIAQDAALQADDAVLAAAGKLFCYLWGVAWKHAPETVAGDADALHDMRVATRRLRSALQNFEGPKEAPLLGKRLRRELAGRRKELGRLGDVLGAVRDYDVLDDYLKEYAKTRLKQPLDSAPGLAHFERFLQTERAQAFGPLVKRVNRAQEPGEAREIIARWALGLPAAETSMSTPPLTLRQAAQGILPQRVAEVLSHAHALQDPDNAEGHHELRKAMKRLRYSLEFFAPCAAQPVKKHVKTLTKLQDLLGEMNDRHVLSQQAARAFGQSAHEYSEIDTNIFPNDVAAFLRYGEGRARRLLQQVRSQWQKQESENWLQSVANLFAPPPAEDDEPTNDDAPADADSSADKAAA
jgi:CHAD domain-containing protein